MIVVVVCGKCAGKGNARTATTTQPLPSGGSHGVVHRARMCEQCKGRGVVAVVAAEPLVSEIKEEGLEASDFQSAMRKLDEIGEDPNHPVNGIFRDAIVRQLSRASKLDEEFLELQPLPSGVNIGTLQLDEEFLKKHDVVATDISTSESEQSVIKFAEEQTGVKLEKLEDTIREVHSFPETSAVFCEHANEGSRGTCRCPSGCYCRRPGGMCPRLEGSVYRPTVTVIAESTLSQAHVREPSNEIEELAKFLYSAYQKSEGFGELVWEKTSVSYRKRWHAVAKAAKEHYAELQKKG